MDFVGAIIAIIGAVSQYLKDQEEAKWHSEVNAKLDAILANTEKILKELQELRAFITKALEQNNINLAVGRVKNYKELFDVYLGLAENPDEVTEEQRENVKSLIGPVALDAFYLRDHGYILFPSITVAAGIVLFAMKVARWEPINIIKFIDTLLTYYRSCLDSKDPESFVSRLQYAENCKKDIPQYFASVNSHLAQHAGWATLGAQSTVGSSRLYWVGHFVAEQAHHVRMSAFAHSSGQIGKPPHYPGFPSVSILEHSSDYNSRYHGYDVQAFVGFKISELDWANHNAGYLQQAVTALQQIIKDLEDAKEHLVRGYLGRIPDGRLKQLEEKTFHPPNAE